MLAAAIGLSHQSGGILASGSAHSGMDALLAACDAVRAGSAHVALVVVSDALVPGLGTGFEARCGAGRPRWSSRPTAAPPRSLLASHGPSPCSTGTAVTESPTTRDLYDPRLFREEMFLPVVREVGEHLAAFDVTAWSLPDPDGRLGGSVARMLGATNVVSPTVTEVGDTGAAAAAARRDRRARRGCRRHRRLGRRTHHRGHRDRGCTGAGRRRGTICSPVGRPRPTPRCCGPGAS